MGANLSPGVEVIEKDLSIQIPSLATTVIGMCGVFSKGPVRERTLITSEGDLTRIFGVENNTNYKFVLMARAMLAQTSTLYLVRTEDESKMTAGVTIATSGASDIPVAIANPEVVSNYPLTYDTFNPQADATFEDQINVFAVGPGNIYNHVSIVTISFQDYLILQDLQGFLADAFTAKEQQEVALHFATANYAANIPMTGSQSITGSHGTIPATGDFAGQAGFADSALLWDIFPLLATEDEYDVDQERILEYASFEYGPSNNKEFALHVYSEAGRLTESYIGGVNPEGKDSRGSRNFMPYLVEAGSDYIRLFIGESLVGAPAVNVVSSGRVLLQGGDSESTDFSVLSDNFFQDYTEFFSNDLEIDVSILVDPDLPETVKRQLNAICELRHDCIALLNVPATRMFNPANGKPFSKATTLIKNYVRDELRINSSFSAIYANYLRVPDITNDTERWIPCTGHVAAQYAYTDQIAEPWYATAGLRRGRLGGVIRVAYNPNKAQRDILYPNRVNPIVDFPGEGPVIMGQKTLQSFQSVFDRVNVRRLFNYVEKTIARFSRILIFEQNNEFLRTQFKSVVNPFLSEIVSREGIDDYIVVADTSNNPLNLVQAHEFNATILIRPVASAEFIKIQFVAVGGTLSFSEILAGANPGT